MCGSGHQNHRKHYARDISLTIHVRLYGSSIIQSETIWGMFTDVFCRTFLGNIPFMQ